VRPGVAESVSRDTSVPAAHVYGVGTFYHLLADPDVEVRVCQDVTCLMRGAAGVLERARAAGVRAEACSCLAACDRPPAALTRDRRLLAAVDVDALRAAVAGEPAPNVADSSGAWAGDVSPADASLPIDLGGEPDFSGAALRRAVELGAGAVIDAIDESGLQGRGGAGFPAAFKWRGVRGQAETTRYVVLNADEGEPGTFKDRETMMRRPDRVVEGLAIAARMVGAAEIHCYLRDAFEGPRARLEAAVDAFAAAGLLDGLTFRMHRGHGAYICGEETALLEAIEGKRGMPRHKPPFPTEQGLWAKPTLVHTVETIACVPAIVIRGGAWFRALGRTGAGTKLYNISGDVARPGTYELPLGVTLDELAEAAGGYTGELYAFCPGGASSGFLPASKRDVPLDFKALAAEGSMLGSAGVVVLDTGADLVAAVRQQLRFFELESCGQCAPCRIGTRFQRLAVDGFIEARARGDDARPRLALADEVAWEMAEASICGLGQVASVPLTTAMRFFPEVFES
jgi:NADH:ubiquinone oxidoreductase subunit F (NADH-binding)